MIADVGGTFGERGQDRADAPLPFMYVGIIPVPSLGRGRGGTGGTQTGLACGAAGGGGGERGDRFHPAACVLPWLSSMGRRGDISAALVHGLHLHPSWIRELSLPCCRPGTVSPVTCRRPGVHRQGVIGCINPKSSFLSCELRVFSAPLLSKGVGALPVLHCHRDRSEATRRPLGG